MQHCNVVKETEDYLNIIKIKVSFKMVWTENKIFPEGWLGIFTAGTSVYLSYCLLSYLSYKQRIAKTKKKICMRQEQKKKNANDMQKRIHSEKGNFDPSIPSLSFKELQEKLYTGKLTALEVLHAFQNKALQVNDELNCVTEFLDDAEARAIQLDQLKPEERGPLHGIPISLKETFLLAGREATSGFAKSIGKTFEQDTILVQVLIKQGAVPFVRTNISQGQLSIECSNPIFGVTKNPVNHGRSSGGSSGGEGALIGGKGSVLGLGGDMGGSIRIPCDFCGISGIRCTPKRLSTAGYYPFGNGIGTINGVCSPMGQNVDALVEMMKATLVPELYLLDPLLPKIPWNNALYESTESLKIGFYTWDGCVEPVPAVERAVLMAKSRLESKGHTVVEFHPPDALYAFEKYFISVLTGDCGKHILKMMKDDVVDPCVKHLVHSLEHPLPSFVKRFIAWLIPGLVSLIFLEMKRKYMNIISV